MTALAPMMSVDIHLPRRRVPDDRSVKIVVELPPAVHRDLIAYAEVFVRAHGQTVELAKLVPLMLAGSWRRISILPACSGPKAAGPTTENDLNEEGKAK